MQHLIHGFEAGVAFEQSLFLQGFGDLQDQFTAASGGIGERSQNMYGRGTSDDKGPMLAALGAVERLLEERGRLPVNVRILLEGEEEIGSPNLEAALAANHQMLGPQLVAVAADTAHLVTAAGLGMVKGLLMSPQWQDHKQFVVRWRTRQRL